MSYDIKKLGEKLKKSGLSEGEDLAQEAVKDVLDWIKESAAESKNPYDDIIVGVMEPLEKKILSELDEIDGKKG